MRHTRAPFDTLVVFNVGVQQFLLVLVEQVAFLLQELPNLQQDKFQLHMVLGGSRHAAIRVGGTLLQNPL